MENYPVMSNEVLEFKRANNIALLTINRPAARNAMNQEILLTGDQFDAKSMLDYGFLNYVVKPELVQEKALELAEKIAANGLTN